MTGMCHADKLTLVFKDIHVWVFIALLFIMANSEEQYKQMIWD
jgi:hypothetical protein